MIFAPGSPLQNGGHSCGRYLASIEGMPIGKAGTMVYPDGRTFYEESWLFRHWAKGLISALRMRDRNQKEVDFAAVEVWLRNYCLARPTESFVRAVEAFTRE